VYRVPHKGEQEWKVLTTIVQKTTKSERLHNAEKGISSKTLNRLTGHVKQELAEVKMSMIRKRSEDHNHKKMY
jgi:hypothetical protein